MNKIIFKRLVFVFVLILVFASMLSGCSALEKFQEWKEGLIGDETSLDDETINNEVNSESESDISENNAENTSDVGSANSPSETSSVKEKQVVLFFGAKDDAMLKPETRNIQSVAGIARATIGQLIAGPADNSELLPTIPEGTKLKDINIKEDGTCVVDFSAELVSNYEGGSADEALMVYSIVNTLSQFESIKQVQILVEGHKIDSIGGHMDISEAMSQDISIVDAR